MHLHTTSVVLRAIGASRLMNSKTWNFTIHAFNYAKLCPSVLIFMPEARLVRLLSRPQFLCSPSPVCPCTLVKRVSEPACFGRIAEISLLDSVWYDDDESKVLPSRRVVQIINFGTQLQLVRVK
jgi:hypothetical protein